MSSNPSLKRDAPRAALPLAPRKVAHVDCALATRCTAGTR